VLKQLNHDSGLARRPIYRNGAHAGNVYYCIDTWGINSPKHEAEFKRRLEELILQLQADWKVS
jgi:hypothetical protein